MGVEFKKEAGYDSEGISCGIGRRRSLWGTSRAWAGAGDRVRVAVIGVHGMGQNHIEAYSKLPNVEVAALCDVDENQFAPVIKKLFTGKGLKAPKTYTDLRRLYEDREIDTVSVVTPNHWHVGRYLGDTGREARVG